MDKNLMLMIILTNSITTFTKKILLTIDYVFPIGLFMSSDIKGGKPDINVWSGPVSD